MIEYTTSDCKSDLISILELQKANLLNVLTLDEIRDQGFVTVTHTYDELNKLNNIEKHIIAKEGDTIIGYLLSMTEKSKFDLPVLIPMFKVFDEIIYKNRLISDYNYIVVGQVCVKKEYRGKSILDNCYLTYKNIFINKYDFAITEISLENRRSFNAHTRIGFKEIYRYIDPVKTEWSIVIWDWKKDK